MLNHSALQAAGGAVSPLAVFRAFLYIGCTAMGGGASAYIHALIVTRRGWLTEAEFLEGLTLAQLLPGPNISNLAAYIGARLAGPVGAALATLGMVAPGTLAVIGLSVGYFSLRPGASPLLEAALYGVAAAAVGVIVGVVVRVAPAGLRSRGGPWIALVAFAATAVLRVNILWVLLALFPLSLALNRPRPDEAPRRG